MYQSIEERLAAAQAAIDGALADTDLQSSLMAFGYSTSQLQEGKALHEAALALRQKQKAGYANLSAAAEACVAAQMQAEAEYMRCSDIAWFVFRNDPSALQKLGLATPREYRRAKWVAQMRQFYTNALLDPAIVDQLAAYDLTQAMLEEGQRLVNAFEMSHVMRRQCSGDARHATKERDQAMVAVDSWMRDFRAIARVALREEPQFLAKLGMPSR